MKSIVLKALLAAVLLPLGAGAAQAGARVGVSIGDQGLEGFFLSIGDHFRASRAQVVYVRDQRIPDDEIPVVFHIAREARVAPAMVVKYRRAGWTWVKIARHYRLSPSVFYVAGYHARPFRSWNEVRFTDREVVRCVNSRFIAAHHGRPVPEVVRVHSQGKRFADIDRDYRGQDRARSSQPDRDRYARKGPQVNGPSKGRGPGDRPRR